MIPINNSDTAWLIVSDYNQDHSLPYEDLREDVNNPNVSQWFCYLIKISVQAGDVDIKDTVGDSFTPALGAEGYRPGAGFSMVGGIFRDSRHVGGNDSYQ